jgi:hypothetical protein
MNNINKKKMNSITIKKNMGISLFIGIFFLLSSCGSLFIYNDVGGNCITQKDIKKLSRTTIIRYNKAIKIVPIEMDTVHCTGLFWYKIGSAFGSVMEVTHALKFKNGMIKSQKRSLKKNKKILKLFFKENGKYFSEKEKKYIEVVFLYDTMIGRFYNSGY